jgi:hypothetical protein
LRACTLHLPAQLLEDDVHDRLLDHDGLGLAQLGEREARLGRAHRRERVQQHRELRVDLRVGHRRYLSGPCAHMGCRFRTT